MSLPTVLGLESDALRIAVDLGHGARVTELLDKRTGRQWLVAGTPQARPGDDAGYTPIVASGWDECFPTVAPCAGGYLGWGPALRDHGALWGRAWRGFSSGKRIVACFEGDRFCFTRTLSLSGETLSCAYAVTNIGSAALGYIWAQHCLLALGPGDRLILPAMDKVQASYLEINGDVREPVGAWPDFGLGVGPLDVVMGPEAGVAAKLYGALGVSPSGFAAAAGNEQGCLVFHWDRQDLPFVGLWLAYGGWGEAPGAQQVAIEPTTAPADDLASAAAGGHERWLAPGDTHRWGVAITARSVEVSRTAS